MNLKGIKTDKRFTILKFLGLTYKKIILYLIILSSSQSYSLEWTEWFTIDELFISHGKNMHFRIYGMSNMEACTTKNYAFINEDDSGAKGKI